MHHKSQGLAINLTIITSYNFYNRIQNVPRWKILLITLKRQNSILLKIKLLSLKGSLKYSKQKSRGQNVYPNYILLYTLKNRFLLS